MALTKVQKTGITDNAIDADKIEDGTIVAADIAPGTITNAKLAGSIANDKLANSSITVNGTSVSLGGSVSAGKVQWQSVVMADGSTGTSATAGYGYFIDTTSAAHTLTLPGSPSAGDTIAIKDYAGTFGTNNLTIARNGNNIQGVANDSLISTNRASVVLVYIDATKGWLYTNESNVADLQTPLFTSATGGTITTSGDYKTHVFTGDGCFVVSTVGNPIGGGSTVDYLVVAGGGGGGSDQGGGGGAGGFRVSNSLGLPAPSMSPLSNPTGLTISTTTYPVTVGGGGAASTGIPRGGSGNNSIFSTITSTGGGGAGTYPSSPGNGNGMPGGSGGGAGGRDTGAQPAGNGNTPPVSPPQGNPGAGVGPIAYGGGGGGASATGGPGSKGGDGSFLSTDFFGPTAPSYGETGPSGRYFSGGGGGRPAGAPPGTGGLGGGTDHNAGNATANTGGGGGGGYLSPVGSGGKGIVIIRYKYQ